MASFSLAICAYNEAANIGLLVEDLLNRKAAIQMLELLVVSSGSTDGTNELMRQLSAQHPRLRLIEEPIRRGKVAAVNTVIQESAGEWIVLVDADCLPGPDTLELLRMAMEDSGVGGVGTKNVPVNENETLITRAAGLMWRLHHEVNLSAPALGGDIIAFRHPSGLLPEVGQVNDDFLIECLLSEQGYRIKYEPLAVTYMRVPRTAAEFLRQRRRIHFGYRMSRRVSNRSKATQTLSNIFGSVVAVLRERPCSLTPLAILACLDTIGRVQAYIDNLRGKSHVVWEQAPSTKQSIGAG